MRRRKNIVRGFLAVLLLGVLVAALSVRPEAPASLRVVSVQADGSTERVTVEAQRAARGPLFVEEYRLQARIGGKWEPLKPGAIETGDLEQILDRTNHQRFVILVPARSEVFRFSLDYRSGLNPYCQVYFFLERNGIMKTFPGLSKAILKLFPQQPKLRHFEWELELPSSTNPGQPADHGAMTLANRPEE